MEQFNLYKDEPEQPTAYHNQLRQRSNQRVQELNSDLEPRHPSGDLLSQYPMTAQQEGRNSALIPDQSDYIRLLEAEVRLWKREADLNGGLLTQHQELEELKLKLAKSQTDLGLAVEEVNRLRHEVKTTERSHNEEPSTSSAEESYREMNLEQTLAKERIDQDHLLNSMKRTMEEMAAKHRWKEEQAAEAIDNLTEIMTKWKSLLG